MKSYLIHNNAKPFSKDEYIDSQLLKLSETL
jgi:hypothetical protein